MRRSLGGLLETDLLTLAKDWSWLIDLGQYSLAATSPFGDLLLRDVAGTLSLLDINLGALKAPAVEGDDPALLFPIAFDDRIASGYRDARLILRPGKCYGYKIQNVTGGSMEPENVYVATITEYVSFMGDFHHQIKDIPDGGSVVLKVINLPKA
jgi:hypothetical protein